MVIYCFNELTPFLIQYFSKPTWEELLPPAVPPFQKPYTLLLSIDDLLVTSTWDVSLLQY